MPIDLECGNVRSKLTVVIDHIFGLLLDPLRLIFVVRDYDNLGTQIVRVLHFLAKGAPTSHDHQEKALLLVEIVHLFLVEVVLPAKRLAALGITAHWGDDLTDAGRAFLQAIEADIGQLGLDFTVLKIVFENLRVDNLEACEGLADE